MRKQEMIEAILEGITEDICQWAIEGRGEEIYQFVKQSMPELDKMTKDELRSEYGSYIWED